MSGDSYIGTPARRPDAPDKASGRAIYIQDLSRPGMLYGKIKFSDHAHARILHIDVSEARKLPGVRAVITAYDTPEVRIGFLRDNFALKKGKVRQFRDEVAAVAAIDPDIAAEAVDKIRIEYEPLPGVFSPEEAMRPGSPLVHEVDAAGNPITSNVVPLTFHHESGDMAAAERASSFVVEAAYSTPRIQQSCMGTAGCVAEFDMNRNLTVWTRTQIPFMAQRDFNGALEAMGLKGKNARVIVPAVGGAFGAGLDTHGYEYIAILLAFATGRPVKIVLTRHEEFSCTSPRQETRTRIRQGCDAEGRLTFRRMDVLQDNGAYTSWGATYPSVMMMPATSLYRVPSVYFDSAIVYTNNTYCQAMRGYGNPEATWPIECSMDELALASGIDPCELRLLNCNEPNETTPMGLKVSTCGLRECLESARTRLDWKEKHGRSRREAAPGARVLRGVGMASLFHVGGGGKIYRSDGSGVILKLDDFGNVNVSSGLVEIGQGLHAALGQAVADALGVRLDHVQINQTDTATCPWDVGTHASRGAFMACNAAILAAAKMREKLFTWAEKVFPEEVGRALSKHKKKHPEYQPPPFDWKAACTRDRFDLKGSVLFIKDAPPEPWLRVELGRFLRAVHFRDQGTMFIEEAFYEPPTELPDWKKGFGNLSATYMFGTQGVEVEVDTETGRVRIIKAVIVTDVGRVLNPQTLKGQMYGGVAQSVGYALYEEILSRDGRVLNPGFTDYKIATSCEVDFPVELEFIETRDAFGPFGAKGVGEAGMIPLPAAIGNAVADAIGVRIRDLPITPEKVLAAIKERSAK